MGKTRATSTKTAKPGARRKPPDRAGPAAVALPAGAGAGGGAEPKHDFDAAIARLAERLNVEQVRPTQIDARQVFRLDRMRALAEAIDSPQASLRCVHVAGSKGKGSVCEMTAAALQGCGYTVGLYTSPHLVDIRERIRINHHPIAPREFARLFFRVADAADALPRRLGPATHFELLTAMALLFFAEQAVDAAVIETGMGGLCDATNIIQPEVCALAAIQLEHTQLLGKTLPEIAAHKAGIIKPGVPVVSVPQHADALAVIREHAEKAPASLDVLGQELDFSFRFEATPDLGPHARVVLTTPRSTFEHLPVPLKGEHQAWNCGLALAVLDKLRQRGLDTPEGRVAAGLAQTPANGRLEIVHRRPTVLVDGAHNPESIHALVKAVGAHLRFDSMVVVFGCMADKDVPGMLTRLSLGADKIIFTRPSDSPRAMDPRDLARKFIEVSSSGAAGHKMVQVAPSLRDAMNLAARAVGRDDLICVTGSFAMAGEAKRLLREKQDAQRDARADLAVRTEVKPAKAPRPR